MGQNLNSKVVSVFSEAVEILKPGASGSDVVELLDGKAERTQANHWLYGRRQAPRWARELLAKKLEDKWRAEYEWAHALAERIRRIPDHPGQRIGRINLAKWKVEQAKKKNAPAE